jgi:chromosome segregation ATPase
MMEKGSFHTSALQVHSSVTQTQNQSAEELVKRVPLPNQLPKGLDFTDLPQGSLKSSALESLIGQNEDLMARLSVALRRGGEFEEKIEFLEKENSGLRSRFETLKEQFLLTQEKDKISTTRLNELHDDAVTYKKQSEKLETLYADLYLQAQAFQKRLQRAERGQARLRKAARSLQKKAKGAAQLRKELDHSVVSQQQAIQNYESKLNTVRAEIEGMRAKVQERDSIFEQKVKLENQLVYEQRQTAMRDADNLEQIEKLGAENISLRTQLKETLVTNESQRLEIERLSSELPHLKQVRENLTEQVESLQALWSHKQKELEALEEKNRALQKLNQSISLTLNQQRKEIHGLEQEVEKERFTAEERIKTMLAEIQMLRRELQGS